MATFTKDSGSSFNRVYEKLRKRSYRRILGWRWGYKQHEAYVRGVRDAVAELQAQAVYAEDEWERKALTVLAGVER